MNGQAVGANTQEVSSEVTNKCRAANSNNPFRACFHSRNVPFMSGAVNSGLTKKAEPPPTRGVDCNRSANGGWLRRLVRLRLIEFEV